MDFACMMQERNTRIHFPEKQMYRTEEYGYSMLCCFDLKSASGYRQFTRSSVRALRVANRPIPATRRCMKAAPRERSNLAWMNRSRSARCELYLLA